MSEKLFREMTYPSSRQLTFDMGRIGLGKHHVKALLEVDVTDAWAAVRESRRSDRKISFIAWLLKVIADCVALHPGVAGINHPRRNKTLVFNDVDLSIMVEKEVNGALVPLPYVVRQADRKSIDQICNEIEAAKAQTVKNEGNYVLGKGNGALGMRFYLCLPQWLRLFLFRSFFLGNPKSVKNSMGTVMVTTVGMVGHTHGWIIPYSIHPLCLALGSINEQPLIHKGAIEKRSVLHLTVLFDHDVIDGMPAARFVDDLVVKLENGFGITVSEQSK